MKKKSIQITFRKISTEKKLKPSGDQYIIINFL